MNADFPRILTLLRKERGISQKMAAGDLGISQALLSHYEKGIRECGLDFVIRCADYYHVSCDYLLGRSPDRSGATLSVEDIPDPDALGKENQIKGSILPTLNKKLLSNSLNILFDMVSLTKNKTVVSEVSSYPVSYTHLDVYKRQALYLGDSVIDGNGVKGGFGRALHDAGYLADEAVRPIAFEDILKHSQRP